MKNSKNCRNFVDFWVAVNGVRPTQQSSMIIVKPGDHLAGIGVVQGTGYVHQFISRQ